MNTYLFYTDEGYSSTTGIAANQCGRRYCGILHDEYISEYGKLPID